MFVGKVGRRTHDPAAGSEHQHCINPAVYACEKAGQVEAVVDRYVSSGLVKADDRETFLQTALTQVTLADGRARGRQECGAFACMYLRTRVYARARVAACAPVGSRVRQNNALANGCQVQDWVLRLQCPSIVDPSSIAPFCAGLGVHCSCAHVRTSR